MLDKSISIIVPAYNPRPEYFEQCLNSLVQQTLQGIEIILVDDGSEDIIAEMCDIFEATYQNIKVIHQENRGVSAARNHGLKTATGEYVLFVDADDWLEIDCCQTILEEIECNQAELLFFRHRYEMMGDREIKRINGQQIDIDKVASSEVKRIIQTHIICAKWINDVSPTGVGILLIRREILKHDEIMFPIGVITGEDSYFNYRLVEAADSVRISQYMGYHYRIYKESSTSKRQPQIVDSLSKLNHLFYQEIVKNHSDDNTYLRALCIRAINAIGLIETLLWFNSSGNYKLNEITLQLKEYLNNDAVQGAFLNGSTKDFVLPKRKIRYWLLRHGMIKTYVYLSYSYHMARTEKC